MYLPKVSPRVIKPVYGLATCETPSSNNGKVIYAPLTKKMNLIMNSCLKTIMRCK